jgi:hypothetical protein
MKEIPLTQGKVVIVDDDMYEYLSQWSWYWTGHYAARGERSGRLQKLFLMHRVVLQAPEGTQVDHINMNKLDCRRVNLRLATRSQNNANRNMHRNNSCGFKGVSWSGNSLKNPYKAEIKIFGHKIYLGCFTTAEDAARAYDQKAKELFGEFARTNF